MSVDGDVSYCPEMDETQTEELKNQAAIKLKDTGATIHIMIKQSEQIHKRFFATEAGVLHSSIASMAEPSQRSEEIKRDAGSSSGEWDEEDGEEES